MDRVLVLAVVALVATPAYAGHATFAVELTPVAGAQTWQADALTTALTNDLADDSLRAAKPAAVIVRGELAPGELRYSIPGTSVRGVITLAGLGRHELAGLLRDELHRLVQPHDEAIAPGPPAELAEPEAGQAALVGLAALAALLLAPLVLAVIALRSGWLRLRSTRRLALALGVLAAFTSALLVAPDRVAELGGAVFVAGGLAWGTFVATMLPVAFPPLAGIQRVEHGELVRVVTIWLALALQRIAGLAIVLVPAGLGLDHLGVASQLSPAITFGVVAPIVGLAAHLAWRALVELLAVRLDAELVAGGAGLAVTAADHDAQPWHSQVRAYLVGYLRRANLEVDEPLLERVRFLPGTADDVAVYGGGLAHTRIVIPRAMLEHALAPYGRPHDYLQPRVSTLHWTHWTSGVVMPTEAGAKLASQEDRKPRTVDDAGSETASERIALGEPPTLTGIIEPVALDPRTSYRPGDDPLWLDWDPGEEYDGTDPGDKDYLFGILVRSVGTLQRHEDRTQTIALAWRRWVGSRSGARLLARVTAPLRAFAARRTDALGDVHAALGGARHHLAQYLAWRAWRRDDLVTARAYVPVLEAKSRAIASALDADEQPALHRRIAGLRITGVRLPRSRRTRLVLAFAGLAGLAGVAALVVQAVRYRDTYEQRMAAERKQHERPDDGIRP